MPLSDDKDFVPPKPAKRGRFATPATSVDLQKTSKGVLQKNDQWALRAFEDWIQERNAFSANRCLQDILKTDNAVLLAK